MEALAEFLSAMPAYIVAICEVIGFVAGIATVIVRITPSPKDDRVVGRFIKGVLKVMSYLPTIGVNPETKKLKDDLKSLR